MSLPLLHAGRTNPGLSPKLDLRFALDKSLTAYRGPTPSFSRASTGSYFDGSGVLRYKGYNLCINSENFSAASWSKTYISASFSTTELSPNGDLTASLIIPSTISNVHHINPATFSGSSSSYTISVYAKNSGYPVLILDGNADVNFGATFNLATGTVTGTSGGATAGITNAGNGWYRCSVTKEASFTFLIWRVYPNSSGVYSGDGSSGVLLWGAQVERTNILTEYSKTTSSANSAPRFDHTYNGTSWVSKGLLVEEQRTNQLTNSNNFSSGFPTGGAQWSSGAAASPDGTSNAWKIFESAPASGSVDQRKYNSVSFSGAQSSFSIYAKAAERRRILLFVNGPDKGAWFDLISQTCAQDPAYPGASPTIQDAGNGWCRCTIVTPVAASITNLQIQLLLDGATSNPSRVGDGASGIYLAFVQHEIGAFPTSYIGTTSSAATRSADVCQITGSDFSGFWNGTEGSVVAEYDRLNVPTSNACVFAATKVTNPTQNIIYNYASGGNENLSVYNGNADQATFAIGSIPSAGVGAKIAFGFKANDFAGTLNGAAVVTDNSGTVTAVEQIGIGYAHGFTAGFNGHIARIRYFNKRLPNATLQLLSDPDPTLNLQFALNKTLTPVAGPAPSFSRASTGTYFNASGVLTSASINTPRFDHVYSGGQWVSKGLLIEEQRANICLQSNAFSTTWGTLDATVTANAAVSPDGTSNAWKLNEGSGTTASHGVYQPLTIGAGTYTWSVYAKAGERNWLQFLAYSSSTNYFTWFNLANGTVGTNAAGTTASIQDVGNGWYRCSVSRSTSAGTSYAQIYAANADNNGSYAGDPTKGIYIYGCQVEAGSFPTSYIGTTSSSVVRSADVCQITGTSFGWMWNQGEGSVFFDADGFSTSTNNQFITSASSGSSSNSINLVRSNANDVTGVGSSVLVGGVVQEAMNAAAGTWPTGSSCRLSFGYKANDFAQSVNGAAVTTDTSGSVPTVSQMSIGDAGWTTGTLNGHISKLIYYPARLTNTKLQQLST